MAYKVVTPVNPENQGESLGQCWVAEEVGDQITLCPFQTIEPLFRKYLPKPGRILEAGCGLGRWVFYLKSLGYDVSGIEYSQVALKAIREYDPLAPIQFGDIKRLDYPDNHFQGMISLGVVEHFEEGPREVLLEAVRVIEDQGYLLVSIPTLNALRNLYVHPNLTLRQGIRKLMGRKYAFSEYRFGKREFQRILTDLGLEIVATAADDFTPPKSIGVYTDFPSLQHPARKWELNTLGAALEGILRRISLDCFAAGTLYVCKVNK